jgi:hypothetical protein
MRAIRAEIQAPKNPALYSCCKPNQVLRRAWLRAHVDAWLIFCPSSECLAQPALVGDVSSLRPKHRKLVVLGVIQFYQRHGLPKTGRKHRLSLRETPPKRLCVGPQAAHCQSRRTIAVFEECALGGVNCYNNRRHARCHCMRHYRLEHGARVIVSGTQHRHSSFVLSDAFALALLLTKNEAARLLDKVLESEKV